MRADELVFSFLHRLDGDDPQFLTDRDTAVRMIKSIRNTTGGGLVWRGADMKATLAVLAAARKLAKSSPWASDHKTVAAIDAVGTGMKMIVEGGVKISKPGTA